MYEIRKKNSLNFVFIFSLTKCMGQDRTGCKTFLNLPRYKVWGIKSDLSVIRCDALKVTYRYKVWGIKTDVSVCNVRH